MYIYIQFTNQILLLCDRIIYFYIKVNAHSSFFETPEIGIIVTFNWNKLCAVPNQMKLKTNLDLHGITEFKLKPLVTISNSLSKLRNAKVPTSGVPKKMLKKKYFVGIKPPQLKMK